MKNGIPDPEFAVELGSLQEVLDDPNWGMRTFKGTIGKTTLKGSVHFVPRGSSGFENTPFTAVVISEPPALEGAFQAEPVEYEGQQYVDGLPVFRSYDDEAVLGSLHKAIGQHVQNRIEPLFGN